MADDPRPPTAEEISDLRTRLKNHVDENGNDWFFEEDFNRILAQDDYVSRFFMHCTEIPGDHMKNTEEMIYRSLKFRKEKGVLGIRSSDLDEGLKAKGSLYLRNRDTDGKQLLVFDVKKHIKGAANMDDMQKMFLYFLERVDREDADGMVTIVFDCAGCGLKNMDMEFIRYMIDVLKDYYPWNLNYILVLDMPWVLNAAWKIIKAWLPAGAVKKIKFVNKSTVDEYIHPEQKLIAWGGTDSWEYEFVEEQEKTNGFNHSSMSSSEEEEVKPLPDEIKPAAMEQKVANATANVKFSVDTPNKSKSSFQVSPEYELVFIKGPKGLMSSITISNNTQSPTAFKIKTTSPERYRVRPSLGLMPPSGNVSIEVFYQPVSPNSDDFTDVLKDKFLITMFMDSAEETYKTDIKDKKPSYQHRLKASVKKSLLKSSPERREVPAVDKDKDVYLKELKALDQKQQQMNEELKAVLFYTRLTLALTLVVLAFLLLSAVFAPTFDQGCHQDNAGAASFQNDIKSEL